MSQDQRHSGLAAVTIVLAFLVLIVLDSVVITIKLQRMAAGRDELDLLNRGFSWGLVLVASGVVPSFILQMFGIRRSIPYLVAGAFSGWFAVYSFWFDFGQTFSLLDSIPKSRAFGAILVDAFTTMPSVMASGIESVLAPVDAGSMALWTIPACCLVGALCGWLYWLLGVRRIFQRRTSLGTK